jgi:hypothetical protein
VFYFLFDSYVRLAAQDPTMREKAVALFDEYAARYQTTDLTEAPLCDKLHYAAVAQLKYLYEHAKDDKTADAYRDRALKLCDHVAASWPKSDVYPITELLAGGMLLNHSDEAKKPTSLGRLENACNAGMELKSDAGRGTAANALFWLATYTSEYPAEGESEEAVKARCRAYADRFWAEADAEGETFALPTAALYLNMIKDKDDFAVVIKRVQDTIAREANYMFKKNKADAELEKTINTYVKSYVDGNKSYLGKALTLQEKTAHFTSFPGIDPNDKYTNAIFRMAQINSMYEELGTLKDDKAASEKLEEEIMQEFRSMTAAYKPEDLTNYIRVQVGDFLVRYVSKFPDPTARVEELAQAEAYYNAVIERQTDLVGDAELGLANALSFSKDSAKQAKAAELYTKVSANPDPAVSGPALVGLTKLHLRTGDSASAIQTTTKYLRNKQNQRDRMDMMLMQGEAYTKANDTKNALLAYMNLFNQHKGQVGYSARACMAIMDIFWKRNNPTQGDRLQKGFQNSDRWTAWNTGQLYVNLIRRSGVEDKLTPEERDEFNKVLTAVHNYGTDPAVMKEDKANKEFQRNLQSSKKK